MNGRLLVALLSTLPALVGMTLASHPVQAQALQLPPTAGMGFGELVANPGEWMTTMFNAALVGLGQKTTHDVVDFMGWLLGTGNLIGQTPPLLTYDSEVVRRLWGTVVVIANAAMAVVIVWGGVNLMTRATNIISPEGSNQARAPAVVPAYVPPPAADGAQSGWCPARRQRPVRRTRADRTTRLHLHLAPPLKNDE